MTESIHVYPAILRQPERRREANTLAAKRGKRYSVQYLQRAPGDNLGIVEPPSMRPAMRSSCKHAARPCPFVSCHHHLAMDVTADGGVCFPHGHQPEDSEAMAETCSLDVAQDGGRCAHDVADLL